MKGRQYVEMNEHETGLPGVGNITYDYQYGNNRCSLTITFHSLDKVIRYTGKKARLFYFRMINDTHKETIHLVKRLACNAVGIPLFRLNDNSRKKETVWARFMVMWYIKKYLNFSYYDSGRVFNKDRGTALHGVREFNKESKYQTDNQIFWKSLFLKKCANNSLL